MQKSKSPQKVVRKVTKHYVFGVIFFTLFALLALNIATWGLAALCFNTALAARAWLLYTGMVVLLAQSGWLMWQAALRLLMGQSKLPKALLALNCAGAALILFVARAASGLGPWAALDGCTLLAAVWAGVVFIAGWSVLHRRIYTVKQRPLWPWEKHDERTVSAQQLQEMWDRS